MQEPTRRDEFDGWVDHYNGDFNLFYDGIIAFYTPKAGGGAVSIRTVHTDPTSEISSGVELKAFRESPAYAAAAEPVLYIDKVSLY